MIVHDSEISNTDRAICFATFIYRLSKISGKCCRDISDQELGNVKKIVLFPKAQIVLTKS